MRQRRAPCVAGRRIEVEAKAAAGGDLGPAGGEVAEPELRPLQVGEDADRPAGIGLDLPDVVESCRCSSWLPWLKLSRKTSTPASNSARIRSGLALAGPSVATILALRRRRRRRVAAAPPLVSIRRSRTRMARKSLTLVRVGPVTTRSPSGSEKSVAVILRSASRDRDPAGRGARDACPGRQSLRHCLRFHRCRRCRRPAPQMPGEPSRCAASASRNSLLRPPRPRPRTVTVVSPPDNSTAGGAIVALPTGTARRAIAARSPHAPPRRRAPRPRCGRSARSA